MHRTNWNIRAICAGMNFARFLRRNQIKIDMCLRLTGVEEAYFPPRLGVMVESSEIFPR